MSDHFLNPIPDESQALEARIVAAVLGEASDFERADLERLCRELPELAIFRRRMDALHALLSEAESDPAADCWRLPPEKRAAIEALAADTGKTAPSGTPPRRPRRRLRALAWLAPSLAACLILGFGVWTQWGDREHSAIVMKRSGIASTPAATDSLKAERLKLLEDVEQAWDSGDADPFGSPADGALAMNDESGPRAEGRPSPAPVRRAAKLKTGAAAETAAAQPAAPPKSAAPPESSIASVRKSEVRDRSTASRSNLERGRKSSNLVGGMRSGDAAIDAEAIDSLLRDSGRLGRESESEESEVDAIASGGRVVSGKMGEPVRPGQSLGVPSELPALGGLHAAGEIPQGEDMGIQTRADAKKPLDAAKKEKSPAPQKPAPQAEENHAANDPFSTFSLNVSDVSFRTACAMLAAGQRPDPENIRAEQFYNAFDYGDPYPATNEPMAGRIEQCAHPVLPGRNLVRIALRTAASGRSAGQPLHLTLLVDLSGSMARADRQAALGQTLNALAGLLGPGDKVTAIGFARSTRLLADSLPGDRMASIAETIAREAVEGGTHLEGALQSAREITAARMRPDAASRIVLLTDGAANLGDSDPAALARIVLAMRTGGMAFDVAGMGVSELNERLLAELARHGNGRFHSVSAEDDAAELARKLAGAFRPAAENVKVQVRFNPSRVGAFRLIGFEKDRLRTEDFRDDAVDAAELAAEEAGVAVYQVEPLANGTGPLGEVSARFRDVASGRMVERSWSIPWQFGVPGFQNASPSMQLAGLAVLCAEKLSGGPMAELIDLREQTPVINALHRHYADSARVRELLDMATGLIE